MDALRTFRVAVPTNTGKNVVRTNSRKLLEQGARSIAFSMSGEVVLSFIVVGPEKLRQCIKDMGWALQDAAFGTTHALQLELIESAIHIGRQNKSLTAEQTVSRAIKINRMARRNPEYWARQILKLVKPFV